MTFDGLDDDLLKLIGRWYEAAIQPKLLPQFLADAAHVFDSHAAQVFGCEFAKWEAWVDLRHGLSAAVEKDTVLDYLKDDPRTEVGREYPGRPISCRLHVGEERMKASRIYRELFVQHGIEYTLTGFDFIEPDVSIALVVYRGPGGPAFSHAECARIGAFLPHLRNGATIMRRLAAAETVRGIAGEALDRLLTPLFIVDRTLHVAFANRAAKRTVDSGVLAIRHGELRVSEAAHHRSLFDAVDGLLAALDVGVVLPARSVTALNRKGLPVTLRVSPIPKSGIDRPLASGGRPAASVVVVDPSARYETALQLLRRLYGLTPVESEVLHALAEGVGISTIAMTRRSSPDTIRTHIKALLRKTGTSRQSDLVGLVSTDPAYRAHVEADRHTA